MRFSCEKTLLQAAVSTASRTVAAKSSIPALEGLLIQADQAVTVAGYNMQTGIRTTISAQVQEGGELVLNARLFGEIIRSLPDDVLVFTSEGLSVHVACGDSTFDIVGLSADDYPELPQVEDQFFLVMAQSTLKNMITETSFAVSTNEARPVHTGALFEVSEDTLTMVAVDGFRLALRREAILRKEAGVFQFVTPGSALSEVEKICGPTDEEVTITLGSRHILFEIGSTQLICRRLEGEFLDYKSAIPRKNPIVLTLETKAMIDSIDRVSVVISEKMKSPVRCIFEQDQARLSAKTGIGEARDICRLSGDGGGLEIGFNNRYLLDALRHAPADTVRVELNTGISPAIIVPAEGEEKFLYMVLPVRLKGN